jgi:alkyl hydroperoxide reductase subunit AhpF
MGGMSLSLDLSRLTGSQPEPEGAIPVERKLIIIGAGPAGLTAGLYAGRALLEPLILVGKSLGGQAATTSEMENYPGIPERHQRHGTGPTDGYSGPAVRRRDPV